MTALEAAAAVSSGGDLLAEMSVPDARKLHAFLDSLLSDVVCRQVLPNVVKPFREAFGLDFSFEPELRLHANSNDSLASCDIEAAVTASRLPGWKHRTGLFYDSFARGRHDAAARRCPEDGLPAAGAFGVHVRQVGGCQ